jgi:hypothetical protein
MIMIAALAFTLVAVALGLPGLAVLVMLGLTQCMVRPCGARGFVDLAMRSCINVSGL